MSYSLEWRCPACRKAAVVDLSGADPDGPGGPVGPGTHGPDSDGAARERPRDLHCPHCDHRRSFPEDVRSSDGAWVDPLSRCLSCSSERLYAQKDFNRKLGVAIVIVGAVLSPWTYGASLIVCMLIDYGLYYIVPEITVCYGCDAIHRGFLHNQAHRAHDPLLAGRFRREAQEEATGDGLSEGAGEEAE